MFELAEDFSYNSLSKFPDEMDTFVEHVDISASDISNVNRYQELKAKSSLTSSEKTELNNLVNTLQNKLFTTGDINKLQACVMNLEAFFKNKTEVYLENLFQSYDGNMGDYANAMNNYEARFEEMQKDVEKMRDDVDAKIAEVQKKTEDMASEVHNSAYFNFDNLSYMAGKTRTVEKSGNTTTEKIVDTSTGDIFATRTTVKNGSGDYTTTTVCNNVVPKVNITVRATKTNGKWSEKVT